MQARFASALISILLAGGLSRGTAGQAAPPPKDGIVVTGASTIRWHPTIEADLARPTIIPLGFGRRNGGQKHVGGK